MSTWTQHGQPPDSQQAFSASAQQQQSSQPSVQRQQVGVGGAIGHASTAQFTNQAHWSSNMHQQSTQSTHQPSPGNWNQNVYPPHNAMGPSVQQNNWLQADTGHLQPAIPTSGYFLNQDLQNYSQQQQHQQTQQYPVIQQAYQPPQQFREHVQHATDQTLSSTITPVIYSRQDNAPEVAEYKANNNNDGWGDWDWNENNVHPHQQQRGEHQQRPILDNTPKQTNPIEDSFRKEEDDTWNWGHIEQANQELNNLTIEDQFQNSQQPPPQQQIENRVSLPSITKPASITTPPPQTKSPATQPLATATQQQTINSTPVAFKPTNLPLNDTTESSEGLQNSSSIPSPVYVSQAKPVSKPPRQYASLLGTSSDSLNALVRPATPPHAFQNRTDPQPASISDIPPISTATLPPPMIGSSTTQNPFKRAGLVQHHRANIIASPLNSEQSNVVIPPTQFYVNPPPPPQDFANPSVENREVIAPDNSEVLDENQEVAPNNDRNEYLQTSHLSEIGSHVDSSFNVEVQETSNDPDDFPPPGLSRLVLGQPENESRQILGTETENNLNIERQADGEDTDPSLQRTTFMPSTDDQNNVPHQIDITTDRNLYLVPGESDVNEQRVVTGTEIESAPVVAPPAIQGEQREVELDGENIEDQHQLLPPMQAMSHPHRSVSPTLTNRDMPLDGASSFGRQIQGSKHASHESESNLGIETNVKDLSNVSTGNDESDQRERCYGKSRRTTGDDIKKRRQVNESKEKRYESEESELSSERERHRYRESSVRSDRDRDNKDRKKRDKRDRDVGSERERDRYRGEEHENRYRQAYFRERDSKDDRGNRYGTGRYDPDTKYETESSTRHERRRRDDRDFRGDRIDREAYEDYRRYRKYNVRGDRDNYERRGGLRSDGDRSRGDRDYRDERDSRRHKDRREKPRPEYDEYRKTSSRNARESDIEKDTRLREKDPRYALHGMYSGYPSYGYDPYAAYYYEQMARTNPQAYSEWYKKYYGQSQAPESITNDGRESVHSGRSSANNEKDRYSAQHHPHIPFTNDYHGHFMQSESLNATISSSMNSTLIESQQRKQGNNVLKGGSSQENAISGAAYYAPTGRTYYARSEYSDLRDDNLSLNLVDKTNTKHQLDPQRLTPFKFATEHPVISLGPGLMVAVKPKYSQNGISNVVKIFKMGANDATNKLFQSFPGPLVRGLTHKKTIIEFCEDQIRLGPFANASGSRQNSVNNLQAFSNTCKPSFTLLWNLLILLLRQNGMVVGTDIAELLIKNQEQFPYETSQTSSLSTSNGRDSQSEEQKITADVLSNHSEQEVEGVVNDGQDDSDDIESKTSTLTEVEITEKFRYHLLYGNVNEALDWAADNNLWGHALFLASKMDRRSHANVMMKFANKLSLNDPLQTLYQLMSGRTPSSVTSVQDERWGDWRPHLAMILSNTSQKPELDRKAITTLGDSLFNRGDLYAAHFCYLMAQVGFSKYPEQQSETTMMHNSIRLVLLGSSHHKEFEEFATNESIMMTEVYEYACSLNDDKFSLVEFQPFKFLLATRMLDYGYQLKCLMYMEQIALHIQRDPSKYTPMFINQVYELADRLKYYDPVLEKSMDEVQQDGSSNYTYGSPFEEQKWLQTLRSLAAQYVPTVSFQEANKNHQNNEVIDQQFSEITRQCNELNLPYTNTDNSVYDNEYRVGDAETQNQYITENVNNAMVPNEQQYTNLYAQNDAYHMQPTGSGEGIYYGNGYPPPQEIHQQQTIHAQQQMQFDNPPNPEYEQTNDDKKKIYEWSEQAVINNEETVRPTISMPNSISQKSGFYDDTHAETADARNDGKKTGRQAAASLDTKHESKNQSKSGQVSNQNSGWFGGIWNKLSLKPKNQMILPDDKNPTIVWDPEKKKWVNTDGDENSEENLKPPPKMSGFSQPNLPTPPQPDRGNESSLQQPQLQAPSLVSNTSNTQSYNAMPSVATLPSDHIRTSNLQSNMFKMQRNRTLKNSYVDVFNPSRAAPKQTEQILAPSLPSATVPSGGFLVPGDTSNNGSTQQLQQTSQDGTPQFYNPNQFGEFQQ